MTGANGVGKTNLLEAIHVGAQGFSPRTRAEARLVRFGEGAARITVDGRVSGAGIRTEVTIEPRERKRVVVNGAPVASADELRTRVAALAFLPDRLAVVKGSPVVRRTYIDRMLGRVLPAQGAQPGEYAYALAQRNEALRRVRGGLSSVDAVVPWTERVAETGTELDAARAGLAGALGPAFTEAGSLLGLGELRIAYEHRPLPVSDLDARLAQDVERGLTGIGPHLRDIRITADARDLRSFGSQGEQRSAVLALVLAEARLLADHRGSPPLLLLDDVLSELDASRRAALLAALPPVGQTVVTATSVDALPEGVRTPNAIVRVTPGEAVAA